MINGKVAIVGVGYTVPRTVTPDLSYKELMYEAAVKAYEDAGIEPKDVASFVSCAEDINEGTSITDEYVPDQLGAVLRPVHTIAGDGLQGLAASFMQVLTGMLDIVVVEAHSKASNIIGIPKVIDYATDPIFNRPLNLHPYYIAGLEMNRYFHETGTTKEHCAKVVQKNKKNALSNPSGAHSGKFSLEHILESEELFSPLSKMDISKHSDGSIVMVLASEEKAKQLRGKPVWLKGISWISGSPSLEARNWADADYIGIAAKAAYKMAGIKNPAKDIDVFEIDDTFSYKELQSMEALGICTKGEAKNLINKDIPINPSGGCLGVGNMLEATGLYKALEIVIQLRGEAGKRQIKDAKVGLAQSWRGIPTTTGCVAVLGN